jgi:hypothetical protein
MATPPTSAAHVIRFTISEAMSVASADEIEDGPTRDRRDATAHLGEDDDPADAEDDDPEQLEAEERAGLRVEDEIADVDEAADRRHDPERDREDAPEAHASPWPSFALASAAACSSCATTRDSVVEASASRCSPAAT